MQIGLRAAHVHTRAHMYLTPIIGEPTQWGSLPLKGVNLISECEHQEFVSVSEEMRVSNVLPGLVSVLNPEAIEQDGRCRYDGAGLLL